MKIYNTLSKQKEEFVPLEEGKVKMYVCGPTVYNYIHIGNARPMIVFDTVRHYLEYKGYNVNFVSNFTDVDDKIIKKAMEEGTTAEEVARRFIGECKKDMEGMNVSPATTHPLATQEIDGMIDMIGKLIENGYAYPAADGTVYYRTRKFAGYGKLSHKNIDDLQAGHRDIKVKEDALDFVLWKPKKEGEPYWESPWGKGRPGWHIECSVMSKKYLGDEIDIHAGGEDLIFPHHENEIAQAEAASGCCFARHWLHNGFITVNDEKMSKSLGNFFLLREILEKFPGDVVRFYLLNTHYRSPIDFDDEKLQIAAKSLGRIRNAYALLQELAEQPAADPQPEASDALRQAAETLQHCFAAAMDDDFNTALAIAAIFDFTKAVNTHAAQAEQTAVQEALRLLEALDEVIACIKPRQKGLNDELVGKLMDLLIEVRQQARQRKDWGTADYIRDALKECGIALEDGADAVRWKILE